MAKDRRGSKEKKLIKCVKAPFRFLIIIKNFYVHRMIRCSGHVWAGSGFPARWIDGLPGTSSASLSRQMSTILALDEDLWELVKAASTRRLAGIIQSEDYVLQRQKSEGNKFSKQCLVPRSLTVMGMETIDEEEPCEFGEDNVNVRANVLPTSQSHR